MPLRSGLQDPAVIDAGAGLPALVVAVLGSPGHGKTAAVARLTELLATRGWAVARRRDELDALPCERERGGSVELAEVVARSERRRYTIIDCPGSPDHLRVTLAGLAQADAVVLVVHAESGPTTITRDHALLARQRVGAALVVLLTHSPDDEDEELRALIESDTRAALTACGHDGDAVPVLHSDTPPAAPTPDPRLWGVVEALDTVPLPQLGDPEAPLVVPIADALRDEGELVILGRVERGTLRVEDELELVGHGGSETIRHPVQRIWSGHREVPSAGPGALVGIPLPWLAGHPGIRRGLAACAPDSLTAQAKLRVRLRAVHADGRRFVSLGRRDQFHMFTRTCDSAARFGRFAPGYVRAGSEHSCTLNLERAVAILPTWPLILRDRERTVALGSVVDFRGDLYAREKHRSGRG